LDREILGKLREFSPRIGRSVEELTKEIEEIYLPLAREKFPKASGRDLERKALRLLVNQYRRLHGSISRSGAEMFEGWIDGDNLVDQTEILIRKISKRLKIEGREQLLLEGLISEDGVPLDPRPSYFGRKQNPNFGKPLVDSEPAHVRTLLIVGRRAGESTWRSYRLTAFLEDATRLKVKLFTPCRFRANENPNEPGQLYFSRVTRFEEIDVDWDLPAIYEEEGFLTPLVDLKEVASSRVHRERIVRVKGDVIDLRLEPFGGSGNRLMVIADESLEFERGVTCFIPSWIPITFTEDSLVLVAGEARTSERFGPHINVFGLFVLERAEETERPIETLYDVWVS